MSGPRECGSPMGRAQPSVGELKVSDRTTTMANFIVMDVMSAAMERERCRARARACNATTEQAMRWRLFLVLSALREAWLSESQAASSMASLQKGADASCPHDSCFLHIICYGALTRSTTLFDMQLHCHSRLFTAQCFEGLRGLCISLSLCVCARARACVRACVRAYVCVCVGGCK